MVSWGASVIGSQDRHTGKCQLGGGANLRSSLLSNQGILLIHTMPLFYEQRPCKGRGWAHACFTETSFTSSKVGLWKVCTAQNSRKSQTRRPERNRKRWVSWWLLALCPTTNHHRAHFLPAWCFLSNYWLAYSFPWFFISSFYSFRSLLVTASL